MSEKLNENEVKVLRAVREAIRMSTDSKFSYFEDVLSLLPDLPINHVRGYLSSLQKKRRIDISDDIFSRNPQIVIMMLDKKGGLINEIIDENDWSWDLLENKEKDSKFNKLRKIHIYSLESEEAHLPLVEFVEDREDLYFLKAEDVKSLKYNFSSKNFKSTLFAFVDGLNEDNFMFDLWNLKNEDYLCTNKLPVIISENYEERGKALVFVAVNPFAQKSLSIIIYRYRIGGKESNKNKFDYINIMGTSLDLILQKRNEIIESCRKGKEVLYHTNTEPFSRSSLCFKVSLEKLVKVDNGLETWFCYKLSKSGVKKGDKMIKNFFFGNIENKKQLKKQKEAKMSEIKLTKEMLEQIDSNALDKAIKELNAADVLDGNVKYVGVSKKDKVRSFIEAVASVPDNAKGGFGGPVSVGKFYNLLMDIIEPEDEPEDEPEHDEPEEKKPTKKAAKKTKESGYTRFHAIWEVLKSSKKGIAFQELVEQSDALYGKKGGNSKVKENLLQCKKAITVLSLAEVLEERKGRFYLVG